MDNKAAVHKLEYKWRIDQFSFYIAKEEDFCSPVFSATTERRYKWRLKIKFHVDMHYKDFLGLHLLADCIDRRGSGTIFAKLRFAVLNDQQEVICHPQLYSKQIYGIKLGTEQGWRFENFIERNKILEVLDDEILKNEELTVYCEVIFSERNNFTKDFDQPISTRLQTTCTQSDYTLPENFGSLLINQNYADVVLSVNDKKYHVHKAILAARSPVFDAMFKHDMKESEMNCINISDIDEKVVEQMLNYIYTGKCEYLPESAEGLFVAAGKYDLKGLKFSCGKVLFENLSVENATRILVIAHIHGANELKSHAIDFIVAHSSVVANTATWNSMIVSHPQLFNEVFKALSRKVAK